MDIKELKEVVDFAVELGNGIGDALADGKITIGDVGDFLPAARAAMPAFSGISNVDDELMDLTDEEVGELARHVADKFDLPQDKAEKIVEDAVDVGLRIFLFVKNNFMKKG